MEYKLTSSQLNFYTKNSTLDSLMWNQVIVEIFPKVYSQKELNNAYNMLVKNNDSMRIRMRKINDDVVAYVSDFKYTERPFYALSSDEDIALLARKFINTPTEFFGGELIRAITFQTPTKSGVITCGHHIVVDGFSAFVLCEHINQYIKGEEAPQCQPYEQYIEKEDKYKHSKRFQASREFWIEQFSNNPVCNFISSENISYDYQSDEFNKQIPSDLFDRAKKFCSEQDISISSLFNAIFSVYIHRMYNVSAFTIGTPVLNRTTQAELNTIGLYMHIIPLVINLTEESFTENAKRIENSWLNLFRHQKFTQNDIKNALESTGKTTESLFDFVVDYLEVEHCDDYEMQIPHNNLLHFPLEIHIQSFDKNFHNLKIRYRKAYFSDKDAKRIHKTVLTILENVLNNPEQKIRDIQLVSCDELSLLRSFNDTYEEYPKDKCLHELFELQVDKTPDKVAVIAQDKTLTYRDLNEQANKVAHGLIKKGVVPGDIVVLILNRNSYLLSVMMGILKSGAGYMSVDPTLPQDRIDYMLSDSNARYVITEDNLADFISDNTENPKTGVTPENICYLIYTSGSTGKPKGAILTHRNIVNYCCANEKNLMYRAIKKDYESIISMATISFDTFVTESFMPLINGYRVILANETQSKSQKELSELVSHTPADVLQITPTKLKLLISDKSNLDYLKCFKAILIGGEILEPSFVKQLKEITSAEIYNIYGPTESTVWATVAHITDPDDITIGKPTANVKIHILDQYLKPVPIGVTGELCLTGTGIGGGYIGKPELTAERYVPNPFGEGKMYRSGDLAYWREDGNIGYVGRNDFQVKIRGLRIELGEIENAIFAVPGVSNAVVVVRTDNDRQFICAFYTQTEDVSLLDIKKSIAEKLPKHMMPHIFTLLDAMPLTPSGKVNRNALPDINLHDISDVAEYLAPETFEEEMLVKAIESVLDVENIGTLHNFFDIGGDSLKAIELTSELEKQGYTLEIKDIFESIDIKELTLKLKEYETNDETVSYGSVLPLTPAQMRVYTGQIMNESSPHYNIPYSFKVNNLDVQRLEKALNELIKRHESLRTHFENRNGEIVAVIEDSASTKVQALQCDNPVEFNTPFDLSVAPLLRVGYYENTVTVIFHHIIADGESLPVFFGELNELYMNRELQNSPVQYGEFGVSEIDTQEAEKYWTDKFIEELTPLDLPLDYPRPEAQSFKGTSVFDAVDISLHKEILKKCKELNITPFVYYMACYNILLSKFSGNEDIVVGFPASGRSAKYLNTIGMFVNTVMLRSKPDGNKTIKDLFFEIRNESVEALNYQNYPFNELVKKLGLSVSGRNPLFDAMLSYQSQQLTDIVLGDKKTELLPIPVQGAKCDINLNILPRETDVVLMAEYCSDLFNESTVSRFLSAFKNILTSALDENIRISNIAVNDDIPVIDKFNNTTHKYSIPDGSTIYSLFEAAAKENKDNICITANGESVTFGEFLKLSERVDSEIRKVTGGKKSIIGVICDRSIEMYASIYGIIRGGNAYLPIDPTYPQDRIDYILENSSAPLVLTQGIYTEKANAVPFVNMTDLIASKEKFDVLPCCANEDDTAYVIYTSGSTGNPKGAKVSHKSAVNRILWMEEMYPLEENGVILQKTPYTFDVSVWEHFWWGIKGKKLAASKPGEHFLPAKIVDEIESNKVTHLHFVPSVFDLFISFLENNRTALDKIQSVKHIFLSGEALPASLVQRFYALCSFENVKLHNLYGPTECAVDVTYYDCSPTDIDPVPIGKPIFNTQIYVVDKYLKQCPIGVNGEILIGGVNVGQGYLNNPTLTAEKFIKNPFGDGIVYKTSDLGYWREDGEVVFCGRIDTQIKLHGQRIEIGEIENTISNIDGVIQCAVIVRDQYICAFYTGSVIATIDLRAILSDKLPQYMIPHSFTHLDSLPMTVSGKLDRKNLPEIDFSLISDEAEYVAPSTQEETVLANILASVLGIERISMLDNYYNIGGDSILAIHVVSELEDMSYELQVTDIMQSKTISDIAVCMKSMEYRDNYVQNEVNGLIPYTPIMRAYLKERSAIAKDFVHTCIISTDCDKSVVKQTLDILVAHHDILRGVFTDEGIEIIASNERCAYEFQSIRVDNKNDAIKLLRDTVLDDKFVKVVFCETEGENLIGITIHHFLIDLVSWEILVKDFNAIVAQINNGNEISLPPKSASFKLWNEKLREYAVVTENKEYWESINRELDNTRSLNSNQDENGTEKFSFTFDENISTKLINDINTKYGTRINEVLVTAIGLAAGKFVGGSVGVMIENHGRISPDKHISVERTIGWFTSCYPVIIDGNGNISDELIRTKDTIRQISKNGVEYLLLSDGLHNNSDIIFNFYRNDDTKLIAFGGNSVFPGKINVNCFVSNGILSIEITAPKCKHKKNICEELCMESVSQIHKIIDLCTETDAIVKTRSDFSDETLTQDELDELSSLFD